MFHPRLRPVFDSLVSYEPDRVARSAAGNTHLLGANESPHDPLPGVVDAIVEAAAKVNRYPDFGGTGLISEIARTYGISEDRIALGAGSVALLQMLFQAIAQPGAEVLYGWRSFELYPPLAALAGVRSVQVPLVDEFQDLHEMAAAVTRHTRMTIVCNPNNPTGTLLECMQLQEFLDLVPADCLVVVDEAYFEYAPDVRSSVSLCRERPNLAVLRTFSKAYGLAGLRIGYLIGDPYVVAQLRKACLPYSLSVVAQAAGVASLRMRDRMLERVEEIVAERTRVRSALLAAGWNVPGSAANFLWLRLGAESAAFGRRCAEAGVVVRVFAGEGVRVSLGSAQDNDAFLAVAARCGAA